MMKNYWLDRNKVQGFAPYLSDEQLANIEPIWDFESALLETVKEKYESPYIKIISIDHVCTRNVGRNNKGSD